ncbi:hypothetical protein SETIT_6G077700v2 [Setaria italica]|uniref:Uncharacterized protein n=1 Tax=Setaria italica TaxID=4555 RepID=A0A368RJA2_SETIT|nr:hypothetical protein SETIT_6G077700v2 [Setaria italica]
MSCFGAVAGTIPAAYYYSSSSGINGGGARGSRRPWRWWRTKCAGIAAAVGSRIRKSIKRIDGRRRRTASSSLASVHARRGCCRQHRRSFAPVYVDELYSHHQQPPKALRVVRAEDEPSASDDAAKPTTAAPPPAHAAGAARVCAADANPRPAGVRATGGKLAQAAAHAGGAMRNVLLRSPGRGGGGVLGVVKGMGEVDLRAELFIRKFKEDMRLQSQRSAEELQAMLARGL